jgi:hypothetical protein
MNRIRDFICFLKKPTYQIQQENLSIVESGKIVLYWLVLGFVMISVMTLLRMPLNNIVLLPRQIDFTGDAYSSLFLVLVIPLYEEFLFRISLRYSKLNLSITTSAIFLCISHSLFKLNYLHSLGIAFVTFLIGYLLLFKKLDKQKTDRFWEKNITLFFYFSSIFFGVLHLANFIDLKWVHFLFFPILVGEQIFRGLIWGYLRLTLKNGIVYSILLHFLTNLPILFLRMG